LDKEVLFGTISFLSVRIERGKNNGKSAILEKNYPGQMKILREFLKFEFRKFFLSRKIN